MNDETRNRRLVWLFSGVLLGAYACDDTTAVTVLPAPVDEVLLTPRLLDLRSGDSALVTATALSESGAALPGREVTWSSSAESVATVEARSDQTALVRALANGSSMIWALVGDIQGGAPVTVTSEPSPDLTTECASPDPAWIWCDDFEADRMSSYFEAPDPTGPFRRSSGVGVEGSSGMRARFEQGASDAGSLHLAFGRTPDAYRRPADAGTEDYVEVFWRIFLRHQDGWIGGGGDKLSRAFIYHSPDNWGQAMLAHVWSGGSAQNRDHLVIDPASGTDSAGNVRTATYNDFANFRWLGSSRSGTAIFDAAHVGRWYCIEAQARLNTPGSSDGVFRLWIDDQLEAEREGLNWVGSYQGYGINAVFLENFWNNGSPVAQERYFDNFVVSTTRIGCGQT